MLFFSRWKVFTIVVTAIIVCLFGPLRPLIAQTANVQFRIVDQSMTVEAARQTPPAESEILLGAADKQPYLVERRVMVSSAEMCDAQSGFDQRTNEPIVKFRFNPDGARRFAQATQENVGRPFAIVVNNEVLSAPVIREPILGGSGQISGRFTIEQANDLAKGIRAAANAKC